MLLFDNCASGYIELLRLQFNCDMLCLSISILTLALCLMNDDHMMKLNNRCASQKTIF